MFNTNDRKNLNLIPFSSPHLWLYVIILGWLMFGVYLIFFVEFNSPFSLLGYFLSPQNNWVQFRALALFMPVIFTITGLLLKQRDKYIGQLRELQEEFEENVAERTLELQDLTIALEAEIGDRIQIEKILKISLDEKDILMREIHHRTKNNLMIIQSLLHLQSTKIKNKKAKGAIIESQNRVKSISLIHERLYKDADLKRINFSQYIQSLMAQLVDSYKITDSEIELNIDVPNIMFDVDTMIPLGLIVNELVTNAFKYAFVGRSDCKLSLNLAKKEDKYYLSVKDNGVGLSNDFDIENCDTLGMKIVATLTNQIEGTLNLVSDNGTEFIISFSESSIH